MTDEMIIKALECCIDNDRLKSCKELGCMKKEMVGETDV